MKNDMRMTGVLNLVIISSLIFLSCPDSPPVEKRVEPVGENPNPMKMWYEYPAKDWETQALPIGNGDLGAMFFGSYPQERIQFNEKTLWGGIANQGDEMQGGFQNFGDIYIDITSHESSSVRDYRRELSISDAIGTVSYDADGVSYKREYFVSFPDKVIVMRFTTPGSEASLALTVDLVDGNFGTNSPLSAENKKTASGNTIVISGKKTTLSYNARLIVLNEGGTVSASDGKITVERADAVTFLLAAATNYDPATRTYIGPTADQINRTVENTLTKASQKTFANLKNAHLADYRPWFDRVTLNLNDPEPTISTDQLIRTQKESNYIDMLYFQFGRYLLISSSRGIQVPNNLQGIWNHVNNPPWASDIHSNINIQMNYWPAEVTNLSELHMPFLNFMIREASRADGTWRGRATNLGVRGWGLFTHTSIIGHNAGGAHNNPGNAWYCMHLWQHYIYTLDQQFLQRAWPVMVSACEFWLDRIILSRGNVGNDGATAAPDGTFEAPRGYSPEQEPYNPNTYAQDGVPYEQQLIWALFKYTIEAGKILGKQSEYPSGPRGTLEEVFAKLDTGLHHSKDRPGSQIGTVNGVSPLAEYKYGNSAQHDPTHRHFSHLMALYPGDQINRYYPEFEEAARASLNGRGNGGTGWSLAQKINAWARLKDGDRARTLLKNALNDATRGGAGIYENLFDAHPPFQIDGNFGATAGIAEMLIQSHREYIEVLPALPAAWSSGSFTGLKAQGNFTVDLEWAGGMPTRCTVYSGSGGTLRIKFGNSDVQVVSTSRGGSYSISF